MAVNLKLLAAQFVGLFIVVALALFLGAGTIAWPAAWAFMILFFGFGIVLCVWLVKHNPGLLTERMTGIGKSNPKAWDKAFIVLVNLGFFVWLVVMALDAVRFHWSQMPGWLQVVGALLLLVSFYILFVTFRENSYLSPVVRVQTERGHSVVSTGPYHYVRHPMYAGFSLCMLGTSLLLGSWFGVIVGLALVVGMARRAVMEEHTLREELQGYTDYMGQVKYRIIPGVW